METTSANSQLRHRPRPIARRTGSKIEHAKVGTAIPVTHDFLKQSFAPVYQPAQNVPNRTKTEGDFYKSLSYLKKHYGLTLNGYKSLPYPHNILMAERELSQKLKTKGRYRELFIVENETEQVCLKVKETFKREFALYYIPVMPIYQMWQKPEQQACAELLTAICAYLYAEAGISFYRDEDTYMFYNYEILGDWLTDDMGDMDEDDVKKNSSALANAKTFGDFIQQKMMVTGFRQSLDSLIANFQAVTVFEKQTLAIAQATWKLWQTYPEKNLFSHASSPRNEDEEDDYYNDNDFVGLDEHIGFIGSINDVMSDSLFRMVNDDFNERPSFQEPEVTTFFDGEQPAYADELAFEYGLLEIITDLCTLFYTEP